MPEDVLSLLYTAREREKAGEWRAKTIIVVVSLLFLCLLVRLPSARNIHTYNHAYTHIYSRASLLGRRTHDLSCEGFLDNQPVGLSVTARLEFILP